MTKEAPVTAPEPASELETLRAQVAELTAIKTGSMHGHRTYCGHADHPTMTALAMLISEKLNWRGEALQSRARIQRLRHLASEALDTWEPLRAEARYRADRKGYSHDEAEAEVYAEAIKAVTKILNALDQPATPGGPE